MAEIQLWQGVRARNLDLIVPGRLVVLNAYWPTYGIDAGLYAWVLTGIESYKDVEAVQCYFFLRNAILWVALTKFETSVVKCLAFEDLKRPRKPIIPFVERFGPLTWDHASMVVDTNTPGFTQKFI